MTTSFAKQKKDQRLRRRRRIRATVSGTATKPRLSIYKSNQFIYGQLIDDENASTIVAVSSRDVKGGNDRERATQAGELIAKEAQKKGIENVVFDRNGFIYTGRVKAFADGVREGGLQL